MQVTPGPNPKVPQSPYVESNYVESPYPAAGASKLPEYLYQAATLLAVLLLVWTAVA